MLRTNRSIAPIILALAVLAWGTPMAAAAVPTATFAPATGAVNIALNANITITFSEAVRKIDGTALFADDLETLVTLKVTNAAGADVGFQPFINAGKTIITINPAADLNPSQAYYVAIGATVENATDEAIAPTAITFTTGPLTEITGTSDGFGDFSVTANENVAIGATVTTITAQGAGTPSFFSRYNSGLR